jgi:hypothetical protein
MEYLPDVYQQTLVLIKGRRPLARLEGRASEPQIQRMIAPLPLEPWTRARGGIAKGLSYGYASALF